MERTTCAYKLKEGVAEVVHKRLVHELKEKPFSINLDECTTKGSNQRILSILVSFFSDTLGECVVQHFTSVSLTVVNANTVFQAVKESFAKDGIPLKNIISSLSDSAAYMRGKHNGFEAKLREANPNLLNIDGDICHHIHNCVKKFCSHFGNHVENLCDDLYRDFQYSPDLAQYLQEMTDLFGLDCKLPQQRIAHRWLSSYDVSIRILDMIDPLTLFYFAWIG
ncbi:hypothetical protein HOLleu_33867 [Holothuria leucospilota]|uniref:DUF4371 domain-containing protein n=1 Tax=Holothuria leucospilota TaxID=206669 RepID=A0A9Q1BHG6_HOLLE|nr:hypothetical protein HOLleu_33867 [Holothuria leucospilota]